MSSGQKPKIDYIPETKLQTVLNNEKGKDFIPKVCL